jgi:hypothetical protein
MIYKTEGDGHFEDAGRLQDKDFFMVNGNYISSSQDKPCLIFTGDRNMHRYDLATRTFSVLERRQ